MTSLADFNRTDAVDDHLAADVNKLIANSLRSELRNTEAIAATKELVDGDCPYQIIEPSGADRTLELPAASASNHVFVIYNNSNTYTLTVKDSTGASTYATLPPGCYCAIVPVYGVDWKIIYNTGHTAFTPSWTAGVTVGNGTSTGVYAVRSRFCIGHARFTLGSTSAITGEVTMAAPQTGNTFLATNSPVGYVSLRDAGSLLYHGIAVMSSSGSTIVVRGFDSSGTYASSQSLSATVPFTWVSGDEIFVFFNYMIT